MPIIELRIQLREDESGQNVSVTGPLQNKVLCYGMLEMAKDAIRQAEMPRVIPAALVPPGLVKS